MVEGGMKCVKILLFIFNLIFVAVGIALVACGAYVQVALKDYFELIEGSFSSAAALLIAVGVLIFLIAFFGCCGAYKENHLCVMIYAVLLVIIFILEISGGIAGFVLKDKATGMVKEYMEKSLKNDNKVWDEVQKDFTCCGVDGPKDWEANPKYNTTLPKSCCASLLANQTCTEGLAYTQGCLTKFSNFVEDKIYIIGAVGIAFAFIQMIGIVFACCLARAIRREYEVV